MSFNENNPNRSAEHPHAFEFCVCGMPRWRHPPTQGDIERFYPYHLFTQPDLGDNILIVKRDKRGRFVKVTQ